MKNVLIVDDNEQNLYMLEILLKSNKYIVQTAKNGKQALEKAEQTTPDLIVSDILMPIMDGFSLCRKWKRHTVLKAIPFIFYTATYTDHKDEEYALSLGADKFIVKPMEPNLFLEQILQVIAETSTNPVAHEPLEIEEEEGYKLYSSRLVKKLEKKMQDLEEEVARRTLVEKELRQSRQEWQEIFQAIGNPAFIIDPDHTILNANSAAIKALEVGEQEILGKKCHSLLHGSDQPSSHCPMSQLLKCNCDGKDENNISIEAHGGEFLSSRTPIYDDNGQLKKIIHIATDITAQKKVEQSLIENQARFQQLVENINQVFWIRDEVNGEIIYISPMVDTIWGISDKEIETNPYAFRKVVHEEDLPLFDEYQSRQMQEGEDGEITFRLKPHDGKIRWLRARTFPVQNTNGIITRTAGVAEDITQAKEAEEEHFDLEKQLQQSQKLEAIGTLAGGIAHDFNNILSSILGFTELSLKQIPSGSQMHDNISEVYIAAGRARDLVKQILTFTRQSKSEESAVQFSSIIDEVLKLLRSTLPTTIEIRQEIGTDDHILGDPTKLHQVMMNLCTNAAQAMENSYGTLYISLARRKVTEEDQKEFPDTGPGQYLQLNVRDTGTGIAPDIIDKIFDPFFTTKKKGKGIGLGLSMVHGILRNHGGNISVESKVDKGTLFKILLPIHIPAKKGIKGHADNVTGGNESIMFVDDEDSIVKMYCRAFTRWGYNVSGFSQPHLALDVFREAPNAFDIIVTDMTMPNLTGEQLGLEMTKIRKNLPIIICTGYSQKLEKQLIGDIHFNGVLMKPVILDELAKLIRSILDKDS